MLQNLKSKISSLLTKPSVRWILIITALGFISRGLGFFRQILIYKTMDTYSSDLLDSALRIPDQIAQFLIMGTVIASVLPVASRLESKQDEKSLYKYLNLMLLSLLSCLLIIILVFFLFMPQILTLPFVTSEAVIETFKQKNILNDYFLTSRILLIGPLLFATQAIFNVFLYLRKDFLVSSLAGIIYNVSTIIALLIAGKDSYFHVAWGMNLGAALTVLIYFVSSKKSGFQGFKVIFEGNSRFWQNLIFNFNFLRSDLIQTWKIFLPRVFILDSLITSNLLIASIATWSGQTTAVNNSLSIYGAYFTIVTALGTVVFPDLAKIFNTNLSKKIFWNKFFNYSKSAFILAILITTFTFLSAPTIGWVFENLGSKGQGSGAYIVLIARISCISLIFQAVREIFTKYFYIQESMWRPVILSVTATVFQASSIFLLNNVFKDAGIAVALSLAVYNIVWLFIASILIYKDYKRTYV